MIRSDVVIPVKSTLKPQSSNSVAPKQDLSYGRPKKKRGRPTNKDPDESRGYFVTHIDVNGSKESNTYHSGEDGGPPSTSPNR